MADPAIIRQGENFILSLDLKNNDTTPILVSAIKSFKIRAIVSEKPVASWTWLPANAGDPHLVITDGLAKLEVEGSVTVRWLHSVEFQIVAEWFDPDFFITGSQQDVICIDGLLKVVPC